MDRSHVALVFVFLRESAFADFKCDRPTSLGVNGDSLAEIFKLCGPSDSLKLRWQKHADTWNFQCETGKDEFEAQLQQAGPIKKMVDAVTDSCREVNFDCSGKRGSGCSPWTVPVPRWSLPSSAGRPSPTSSATARLRSV